MSHGFLFCKFATMKRITIIFLTIFSGLYSLTTAAQTISYPSDLKAKLDGYDKEITEWYALNGCEKTRTDANSPEARIAIPSCPQSELLWNMVRKAGGTPVLMPAPDELSKPAAELHYLGANWDGVLMPDDWVKASDEYSLAVYKTVADLNLPYIGVSQTTKRIDSGLRRLPCGINSLESLVRKARTYRKAKGIMDEIFTIDTHNDLPENYGRGWSVGKMGLSMCSVPKMDYGHLDAQVLASFLWQKSEDAAGNKSALAQNLRQIAQIKEDIEKHSALCGLATTPEEAYALHEEGKKAFFIGVENGYGLGGDVANVKKMRELGVIYITLSHFRDNAICNTSSRHGSNPSKGLTAFGIKVVEEMNRYGIMVDLSHPSAGTFWDCIKYSKAPVICSHSGAKAIYGHDRGLDDRQLRALAKNGGVIQVYAVPEFLTAHRPSSTINDMMKHFFHCVEIAGPDHVGIGSDFDGGGGVWGCNGDNDLINVTVLMLEHGYTKKQIKGFWGGNFMRVMSEVQSLATYR